MSVVKLDATIIVDLDATILGLGLKKGETASNVLEALIEKMQEITRGNVAIDYELPIEESSHEELIDMLGSTL